MRRWIATALGGCALLAVWALPPRDARTFAEFVMGARYDRYESPELTAYRMVRAETNQAAEVFQRLRWRDSLAVLATRAAADGSHSVLDLPAYAPPEARPELQAAVQAQLQEAGVSEPRVPVGVAFLEAMTLAHPWQVEAGRAWSGEELLISTDPDSPYCIVVEHYRRFPHDTIPVLLDRAWRRRVTAVPGSGAPSPLGPCVYHALYGNPGPEILRWLAREGYSFAKDLGSSRWLLDTTSPGGDRRARSVRRGLFGARRGYISSFSLHPDAERCLAGDPVRCADVVTLSEVIREPLLLGELVGGLRPEGDPLALPRMYLDTHFLGADAYLFRALEDEFGRERFQRFWSSDLSVEGAFHDAFGEPLGEWVMRWGQERFGVLRPEPPLRAGATFLTLLMVGLLAGVAVLARGRPR